MYRSILANLALLVFGALLVQASLHDVSFRRSRRHQHLARTPYNATTLDTRSLVERAPPSGWTPFVKSGNDGGGCYVDSSSARILTGYSGNDGNNGLQSCLNTCQSKGFSYGGVQYGTQCYVSPLPQAIYPVSGIPAANG